MNLHTLTIVNVVVLILSLTCGVWAIWQIRKLKLLKNYFAPNEQPQNLEEILASFTKVLERLKSKQEITAQTLERLGKEFQFAAQKSGIVRFNSFPDQGGNLSFSLAILDFFNSGIVITNLHGRDSSRMYAKPIIAGTSELQLTTEEQTAVSLAIKRHQDQIDTIKQLSK